MFLTRDSSIIIIFLISVSIVFLNVSQTFMAGQPGMSTIKINWRCNIFQPMKIYKRSLQGLLSSTPYSFAARSDLCSLAAHFTHHTWRVLIFNTQINVIP